MENFCKHAEDHLHVLDVTGEAEEVEGKDLLTFKRTLSIRLPILLSFAGISLYP